MVLLFLHCLLFNLALFLYVFYLHPPMYSGTPLYRHPLNIADSFVCPDTEKLIHFLLIWTLWRVPLVPVLTGFHCNSNYVVHCACLLNKKEPTFSRNTSLFVNLLTAIRESCTIPMTGLFDCGVTMFLGTIMISVISARASRD